MRALPQHCIFFVGKKIFLFQYMVYCCMNPKYYFIFLVTMIGRLLDSDFYGRFSFPFPSLFRVPYFKSKARENQHHSLGKTLSFYKIIPKVYLTRKRHSIIVELSNIIEKLLSQSLLQRKPTNWFSLLSTIHSLNARKHQNYYDR